MNLTPLEKRAARKSRNTSMVDMNLVSLIDVFTILIFFLLSNNSSSVEAIPPSKSVMLPESTSEKAPTQTIVVIVNNSEIIVEGRKVADVAPFANTQEDLIPPLKAELDALGSRQVVRADNAAKAQAVTIMGDKDIPYQLLRKVMVTCALANFTDVSFAVRSKV
jgi:biopolymer transport protein ExbD